jgi:hypothetical protein
MTLRITTLGITTLSTKTNKHDTQHNDTQHNGKVLLCCVIYADCSVCRQLALYAECHCADCRYDERRYAECRYAAYHCVDCRYVECSYAGCRCPGCHSAKKTQKCKSLRKTQWGKYTHRKKDEIKPLKVERKDKEADLKNEVSML